MEELVFIISFFVYYFWSDNFTIVEWFYFFITASVLDILSTYVFVYIYGLGWEEESNRLIQFFAKNMNYHWALILQTLVVCIPIGILCLFWPWPGFSVFILITYGTARIIAGIINLILPIFIRD